MHISKHAFSLAKTPLGDLIVGLAFGSFSNLLPVKRIKENDKVIAFWHPKPFWQKHILIIPKKPIKNITAITPADQEYILEVFLLIKEIILELGWNKEEYSVLINGGKRQEVNQLHFHLFTGKELS